MSCSLIYRSAAVCLSSAELGLVLGFESGSSIWNSDLEKNGYFILVLLVAGEGI